MDFNVSDIVYLVVLLVVVVTILNDGNWGGGRRIRTDDRVPVPVR